MGEERPWVGGRGLAAGMLARTYIYISKYVYIRIYTCINTYIYVYVCGLKESYIGGGAAAGRLARRALRVRVPLGRCI